MQMISTTVKQLKVKAPVETQNLATDQNTPH